MSTNILQRNHVRILGGGQQTIVFGHGFGCDQNMWRFITPSFEDQYRVVLFDYVGSGASDVAAYNKDRYGSLEGYVQDLLDVCAAADVSNAIFVGHSVSAMIGMLASLQAPHYFKTLVMVGPSPCYLNDQATGYKGGFNRADVEELLNTMDKNYIGWAKYLAPAVMGNSDKPELSAELKQSFCSTDPVIARRFAEVTFFSDNRQQLAQVAHPTLIMQCAEDIIAPPEVGQYLASHIPGSTLEVMQATGHCPHLSAPQETITIIKNYLNTLPAKN